jgi:predicted outer membrane repeat protein
MKTIYFVLVFFLLSTFLYSTIINVPADQPTIQAGIDVAVDADTVLVQPGTYVENINYNGKLITVASLFLTTQDTTYISQTVIDGNQDGSVVTFESGEDSTAVLCGFTITNGIASVGGGIHCYESSPSLKDLTITGNGSAGGGGISCEENSNPSIINVTITGNSAEYSGGGIRCFESSPILQNVTITGNSTSSGGGISCEENSNPSLINVTISDNSAASHGGVGGGIHCSNSSPILQNVTISGNSATWGYMGGGYGGGISCEEYSNPSLVNVTITGNSANYGYGGGGYGGGVYCNNSSPSLDNVTISGNTASFSGGGICCWDNSSPSFDSVDRCNIFLNFAGSGCDLYALDCPTIDVIVDTFTVLQPDDYFAYPIDNFTFDILNAKVEQVDQDLYVSPDGSDNNSGFTVDDPLLTISYALTKILADSTNSLTINLSNGTYSSSGTGEIFPLNCRGYVSLLGEDEVSTILDGEGLWRGILLCENDNNFSIDNMTIQNCSATYNGGGIYCSNSNPSLMNVTITGNGGGIYCSNSNPSLENVTITSNSATYGGGGIWCYNNSSPSLVNVIISDNSVSYYGGGIYCQNFSNPSLVNVTITGNTAGSGGGICCSSNSSPSLVNVTIISNSATYKGGGICCYNSNPSLMNVTITSNSATYYGGGIYCAGNSAPDLVNCIMWNDTPEEIYFRGDYDPNSITISYSDIQGGEAGIVTNNNGTVNWLEGNMDEDPLFVGTGVFPYSLLEDSPCIDAGNPDPIYYDPEDPSNPDYALYPAMGTIINDMGAYGGPNAIGWLPVGVEDNLIVQTPEIFLHQNYPNPFNPSTTINYSLKENANVSLNIYNIKGQKVKQLVSEQLSAGQHSVVWNGKDNNGKSVSSGIYFYKLKAGDFQKVKKMILMK